LGLGVYFSKTGIIFNCGSILWIFFCFVLFVLIRFAFGGCGFFLSFLERTLIR